MKLIKCTLALLFMGLCFPHTSFAREGAPITPKIVTASLISPTDEINTQSPTTIALRLQAPEGWHTYWKNPGDSGMPTTVHLKLPEGYTASHIQWPAPARFTTQDIVSFGYHGEVFLPITITPPQNLPENPSGLINISARAEWLACKDICVPETADLELVLSQSATTTRHSTHAQWIEDTLARSSTQPSVPLTLSKTEDKVTLFIDSESLPTSTIDAVDVFPITENIIANQPPLSWKKTPDGLYISVQKGNTKNPTSLAALVQLTSNNHTTYTTADTSASPTATDVKKNSKIDITSSEIAVANTPPTSPQNETLFGALLLALLGGLILNVMPCVLPVLSLKLLSLAKKAHVKRSESFKHGIAYTLGVLSCFTVLGLAMISIQQAGTLVGWGFQLQSPLILSLLTLLMFLVGLNLLGVYQLPDLLGNRGSSLTNQNNAYGSFFTGALAAIAATPCTAPFMAPAVGFALTQPPLGALLIFEMIGVGMALPYILISLFPSCLRILPKSGAWMETLRQFFAFPMFATSAWLLWVIGRRGNANALAPILTMLLTVSFMVWVHTRLSKKYIKTIFYILSFVTIYYCASLTYHSANKDSHPAKESSISYHNSTLQKLIDEGKPVFVNATADWCLTCKVNEISTLSSEAITEHFATQGITYMIADWTNRDDSITQFLRKHARQGVPTYVFYPPHGKPIILPQILSTDTVIKMTCVKNCEAH